MGSQTASGYPYPTGTDRVMDGDDAIKALAEAVEARLRVSAAGLVVVNVNAAINGSTAVTFPVGRFSAAPAVAATVHTSPGNYYAGTTAVTATGTTVFATHRDGTSGTIAINASWIATAVG